MSDRFRDRPFRAGDIGTAFALLSRLPVPVDHEQAGERAGAACWAWPLVGAALGGLAGLGGGLAALVGAPPGIAAAVALALLVLLSGALHEDALADSADGLGGGGDRQARLAIMRDSRIGAFGASALALALLARFSAIETLAANGTLFWALVAAGAASRLPMALALLLMPPARREGLSAGLGLPPPRSVALAAGLAALIGLVGLGSGAVALMFWVLVAPLPLFWLAGRLIGGQTGDILGAGQQLAEIAALAVAVAVLA